jgi:membrane protein required for colicin V production
LAVVGWIGATAATIVVFPYVQPIARQYIQSELTADVATGLVVFVVVLILLTWISHKIARLVRESPFSAIDRWVGLLFGLARGAVMVAIAWVVLAQLAPPEDHPEFIREARILPWVDQGSTMLLGLVPEKTLVEGRILIDDAYNMGGELVSEHLMGFVDPDDGAANSTDSDENTGYKMKSRRELNRLIEDPND